MLKKKILFILVLVIILNFFPILSAQNYNVTITYNQSKNEEIIRESSKLECYQEVELTSGGLYNTITMTPLSQLEKNRTNYQIVWNFMINDSSKIFDLEIINNGTSIKKINFLNSENNPVYIPITQGAQTILKFRSDQGLKPVGIWSEWTYPFDKYSKEIWGAPFDFTYGVISKILYPDSFTIKKSYASSPQIFSQLLMGRATNSTTGEIISEFNIGNLTFCKESYQNKLSHNCESYDYQGNKFCIIDTLPISPNALVDKCNFYLNISKEVKNEDTGYYVYIELVRTQLVKFIFIISSTWIIFISVYFYFWNKKEDSLNFTKKIYKIYGVVFIIWAFQEGIVTLTSLSRPLNITLFDITILFPFLIIFPSFLNKLILKRDRKKFNKKLLKIRK